MYTTIGTYNSLQVIVCCPGWIGNAVPIQPGQQTVTGWRNILRLSCASSYFFYYAMMFIIFMIFS